MSQPKKYHQDPLITCFVPVCKNTVLKCPEKYFFPVPTKTKSEWCTAVHKNIVPKSYQYICEDHLNLEEDLQNYEAWKRDNVRGRLKPFVPSLKNISPTTIAHEIDQEEMPMPIVVKTDKAISCVPIVTSKHTQAKPRVTSTSINVRMPFPRISVKTSYTVNTVVNDSPSLVGSTTEFSGAETSESESCNKAKSKSFTGREFMLNLINRKPMSYIGIPKQFYWIIEFIEKKCKVLRLHIIITLYKIRNNDTFSRIKDLFEISLATLWRLFYNTLPILKSFFIKLTHWPSPLDIKRNLPLTFRVNKEYASVQSIIDCFEIQIEKPRDPEQQALTWSQYKGCNTIKYLIGSTPDGYINFISEGYGGRISDINIVEQSGFLEIVPDNSTILADRGFKHLESLLITKNVKVLRPPSVSKDTKMTKAEVLQTKVIASLRVHIERVIRRVRLFKLLKPHAVVSNKIIKGLDDAVIVACGLINLQTPIIKYY